MVESWDSFCCELHLEVQQQVNVNGMTSETDVVGMVERPELGTSTPTVLSTGRGYGVNADRALSVGYDGGDCNNDDDKDFDENKLGN